MHDETRQHDSELGKLLGESYKIRKQVVQHSIQNKISADRLNFFNNKCVSSKNNSKGFWKMLREDKSRRTVIHHIS